jgi:TPR repeat protein
MNMPHIDRRIGVLVLVVVFSLAPGRGPAAEPGPTNGVPRLRFAVLPFRNASGEPSLDPWRLALAWFLEGRVALAEGVRGTDWNNTRHALTNAGWTFKGELNPSAVPAVARQLKLDAVLWGSFTRPAGNWTVQINLRRSPFTNPPVVLEVKAAQTAELLAEAPLAIAQRLQAALPPGQREKWLRHGAGSNAAWDGLAQSTTLELQEAPRADQEQILRQVLAAEPGFLPARLDLANVLRLEDRTADAEAECRRVIKQAPDLCSAHELLAVMAKDTATATAEAREALRLQPGCPRAFRALFVVLYNHQRWQELRDPLEKANQEHPGETSTQAFLAMTRASCEDREGAANLLEQIGNTTDEVDQNIHIAVASAALSCGDILRSGSELRWLQERAKHDRRCANTLEEVDASFDLTAKEPFPISRPRVYTSAELQAQLRQRLTPEELPLVVNPVEITPEITALAKEITGGLTNQALRALLLFSEVAQRGRGTGEFGARTAQESLEVSKKPEGRFSCQEFAKLFVALARASGLEAWMVHVDELDTGQAAFHDCAALFLPGQAWLVDPAGRAICIHHRRYRVMDDVQAIAHQAMQGQKLPRLRLGPKLDPDDIWTRLRLVCGLADSDLTDEAQTELRKVPATGTNRWDFWYSSAEIHGARRQWAQALTNLHQALNLSPSNAVIYRELKGIHAELKDTEKARECAELELRWSTNQTTAAERSRLQSELAVLGAFQQARSATGASREALRRRAQAGSLEAQMAMATLCFQSDPPELEEALEWFHKAAEQGNAQAQENYARNLLGIRGTNSATEAVRYLQLSAEQGYSPAQYLLGSIVYTGKLLPCDKVAACQWILLAARDGERKAKSLLKELQLFLDKDQLAEARRRADAFEPKIQPTPKTQ